MNYGDGLTILSEEEIWGDKKLEVLEKYGTKAAETDLAKLMCGESSTQFKYYSVSDDNSSKGFSGNYYTKTEITTSFGKSIMYVHSDGSHGCVSIYNYSFGIRPVIKSFVLFNLICHNGTKGYNDCEEVELGEYPQYAPSDDIQKELEEEYKKNTLQKTGKDYTFTSIKYGDPINYDEYEYNNKKYIRVKSSANKLLSNGKTYKEKENVWIEVSPVSWLMDSKTQTLISKRCLLSGVPFQSTDKDYDGNFSATVMKEYLDNYMIKDLDLEHSFFQKNTNDVEECINSEKKFKQNPYNLTFDSVSEEDIIKGCIESGVAVFLHGPSSEGKSSRIKQIDPNAIIIYLRNATPESLNGKSVYNQDTHEMIDIKPSWLKKLENICESEPDKLHIVFFDEITNALPSIQGIAFNIILDKEVNGIWKLPDNARIVAAGNEMKDSLAANQLAEPLFNRFAHVYIKTTPDGWLKWASENNIHPAICAYIAYTDGKSLRSKYTGEKPNADPRKWEMASKMLYKTGNPKMIRSLVGEDITNEFVEFCNQEVITLEGVLQDKYTLEDIALLNTASSYLTAVNLSQVDEENYDKVRNFVSKIGPEYESIFNSLYASGNEKRLEQVAIKKLQLGG